ncbi:unnamed protein product [Caretta caretta]
MMIVKQASDLWADHLTATDAFVKIFFESKEIWTGTIWNNNNPIWNVHLDFGTICITSASKIRVPVWDEDNNWDDDLLGSCDIPLDKVFDRINHRYLLGTLRAFSFGPQFVDFLQVLDAFVECLVRLHWT